MYWSSIVSIETIFEACGQQGHTLISASRINSSQADAVCSRGHYNCIPCHLQYPLPAPVTRMAKRRVGYSITPTYIPPIKPWGFVLYKRGLTSPLIMPPVSTLSGTDLSHYIWVQFERGVRTVYSLLYPSITCLRLIETADELEGRRTQWAISC